MGTVLVVEDNADLLTTIAALLRLEGWVVIACPSAADALEIVQYVRVDVVLSDLILGWDGALDLEQAFRRVPQLARIPFVFMTGYDPCQTELADRRVLLKPFSIGRVCWMLDAAVRESAG